MNDTEPAPNYVAALDAKIAKAQAAPQPLTGDDLAAIKARLSEAETAPDPMLWLAGIAREDVPRLVAEVERLRAEVDTEYQRGYDEAWNLADGSRYDPGA